MELAEVILTIKRYLELSIPKEIYIPYPLAKFGRRSLELLVRALSRIGVEARMPGELMFLENFYKTQTLSPTRLLNSSYRGLQPEVTVYSKLPDMIEYYLTRWEQLNLISSYNREIFDPGHHREVFVNDPQRLLETMKNENLAPFPGRED